MLRFGPPFTAVTSSSVVISRTSPAITFRFRSTDSQSYSLQSSNFCFQQVVSYSSRLNCYRNKATAEAAETMAGSVASPSASKQALISLSDKKDLDLLATGLQELGYHCVNRRNIICFGKS